LKDHFTKQESEEEGLLWFTKQRERRGEGTNKTLIFPVKIKQVPYQRKQETSF